MEVKAKRNIIYKGEIYRAGEKFECEEAEISSMQSRNLIEAGEKFECEEAEISSMQSRNLIEAGMSLPSLEEEIKRKKR